SAQARETRVAVLAVAQDRAGALRARAHPEPPVPPDGPVPRGMDLIAVPYDRTAALADEITGYTDAVVALGPAPLREAVVARLRAAVEMGERLAGENRG
uniref:WYL domain-containing protein n=1 Tax=Actinotalea sp. C106 TaxID=2908644 RepID=UPI0035AC11F3